MRACKVDNCNNQIIGNKTGLGSIYCKKHYMQIWRHGKISERTRFDKNEIKIKDDICVMDLYKGYTDQIKIAETIFDLCDLEEVKKYKWAFARGVMQLLKLMGKENRWGIFSQRFQIFS